MIILQLDSEQLSNLMESAVRSVLKETPKKIIESSGQKEEILTVQETADRLHLTVPTVYSKSSRREIPSMKKGKRLYFSSLDIMEYLKKGRRKSMDEIEAEADQYLTKKNHRR